jgi:hypothetical protein
MLSLRILLRLVPALLAVLLCAAPSAAAEQRAHFDACITTHSGGVHNLALPPKLADHAIKRPRQTVDLEEFVGLDDDAEQYLRPLAVLLRPIVVPTFVAAPATSSYRAALPSHPACAAPPTGPPHA